MKKILLALCVGAIGIVGCASDEPASGASTEPTPKTKPEGDKATTSNQQLTINPDYKGN